MHTETENMGGAADAAHGKDGHGVPDLGDKNHLKVTLVWGGTGESKTANVTLTETVAGVFELVYQRFHQKASDQDTFEVNGQPFPRSDFGVTVEQLVHRFGPELEFEIIPPTSGA